MRKLLILVAVVAVLLAGATIAAASIPDSQGIIHGCYKNSTGDLKVIDDASVCPTGYTALNWDQQADPVVLSQQRVSTITNDHSLTAGEAFVQITTCPSGSEVAGGGYALDDQAAVRVVQSTPDSSAAGGAWAVRIIAEAPTTFTMFVYASCIALT